MNNIECNSFPSVLQQAKGPQHLQSAPSHASHNAILGCVEGLPEIFKSQERPYLVAVDEKVSQHLIRGDLWAVPYSPFTSREPYEYTRLSHQGVEVGHRRRASDGVRSCARQPRGGSRRRRQTTQDEAEHLRSALGQAKERISSRDGALRTRDASETTPTQNVKLRRTAGAGSKSTLRMIPVNCPLG